MMTLLVHSIGTTTPEYSVDQSEAADIAADTFIADNHGNRKSLSSLYRKTGVRQRHSVLLDRPQGEQPRQTFYARAQGPDDRGPTTHARMRRYAKHAPELAESASRQAMQEADLDARRVTHLVTVSCTGFDSPGLDIALIKRLGLPSTVGRVHIGFMGCHGALNGLRVARAFATADPCACVLLCAVELCTLHSQYGWDSQKVVSNALFSDGAAAMVASGEDLKRDDCWKVAACGSQLIPDSEDAMTWQIGDHGFEMSLSPRVPGLIDRHLRLWLSVWLESNGYSLDDVKSWAIHPGGPRIVSSVADSLCLSPEAVAPSNEILAAHGNMSSPTLLFVIRRLQQLAAARPCLALGFGPGLVVEAALFD